MPWSLEEQLLLLGSALFEELCSQIIASAERGAQHLFGKGGDEGIDIRAGDIDPAVRAQTGSTLTIWQVKFFRDGIGPAQKKQVEESFGRAQTHQPDRWVLCLPRALTSPKGTRDGSPKCAALAGSGPPRRKRSQPRHYRHPGTLHRPLCLSERLRIQPA